VVLMGETLRCYILFCLVDLSNSVGCGKTALIKYLACAVDVHLEAVDIHGGIERTHIRKIIKDCKKQFSQLKNINKESKIKTNEIWLFLDEFNTSPDIGWFNELICNHSLDGIAIPHEIKIIAACNPYRERKLNKKERDWFRGDSLAKY
ncbi:hypothetical protein RFI_28916, partial [Reticulomyxa filosa]